MKLDFDPFSDKSPWEDRPERKAADVAESHESTRLDRKLKRQSYDNRKWIVVLRAIVFAVIVVVIGITLFALLLAGFKYSFM